MTDKYYGIYFDKHDLEVNRHGDLMNPEVLQIIEFEYKDENSDEPTAMRRVDKYGKVISEGWKDWEYRDDIDHLGRADYFSMQDAFDDFYRWLEENTEWRESSPETYWQPAEYVCVGITDCVDEPPSYHRSKHSWWF